MCWSCSCNSNLYDYKYRSTDATGITVTSDNPEFVVSNLSGTTALANSASPLTFQVTFTPTAAGPQSANITVASTTSGSNSPLPVVTGTGLAKSGSHIQLPATFILPGYNHKPIADYSKSITSIYRWRSGRYFQCDTSGSRIYKHQPLAR